MIYQLFYKHDHKVECFNPNYCKLDLSTITDETYLPSIQSEYCGMLYVWMNQLDKDGWIGFTSCKQFKKRFVNIVTYRPNEIENTLQNYDIITWGFLCKQDSRFARYSFIDNLFDQAEYFHPGLMNMMDKVLNEFGYSDIIQIFKSTECGIYANYWLMSKDNFNTFMEWSFPIVKYMVKNAGCNASMGHYNSIGFAVERMFIYWYMSNNKTIKILNVKN